jgi:DNA-directed RNA polymerase specialized sigma24 family protein
MTRRTAEPRRRRVVLRASLDHVAHHQGLYAPRAFGRPIVSRHAVRSAVRDALTAKQREAVELHFFEGLSQGEIARRLGISQQVVQKRLYGVERDGRRIGGALAKLRAALGPLLSP